MGTNSNEDLERRQELANEFGQELKKREEKCISKFSKKQKEFLDDTYYPFSYDKQIKSELGKKLLSELKSGKYSKPSEFFLDEMDILFEGYILKRYKEAFLYSVDNCNKYQYSHSYYRRSFRSSDYSMYIFNIMYIVEKFHKDLCFDTDVCSVLQKKVSEREMAYMDSQVWTHPGFNDFIIAYELDMGNKQLEDVLTDIVMNEGDTPFNHAIIFGIVKSNNSNMHKLLGKLLLAARLQEGLRQAICEGADAGTKEAFLELLNVIDENNLMRFSSVKRAVGTWIGLLNDEMGDIERISDKSLSLIKDCITDERKRKEYLESEDSMKIYIALWSYGFYDVKDTMNIIEQMAEKGTNHQILTGGYFVENLDNKDFAHEVSKKVIGIRNSEMNVLAVYMPYFMKDWNRIKDVNLYDSYYADKNEALKYYDVLKGIYDSIPKKALEYSPCIFPWNKASLTKSDVIIRLCITALYLKDNDKIDFTCELIQDCDKYDRSHILQRMLNNPVTSVQKMVLTRALGDKETYTRQRAYEIICNVSLEPENYLQMEDMLKYKAADMRSNLIKLLYMQEDDMLYGTVERLLSDKKEEKRTAALDIIMQLSKDSERKELFEKCRLLAENLTDVSTKERILIDNIMGGSGESGIKQEELYTEEDRFIPYVPENYYINESIDLFMEYFPDSSLKNRISGNNVGISEKIKQADSVKQAVKDCEALSELIKEHQNDEFVGYNGEVNRVGDNISYFRKKYEKGTSDIPLMHIWKEWYEKEINSTERLTRMMLIMAAYYKSETFTEVTEKYVKEIYGAGFEKFPSIEYPRHVNAIIGELYYMFMDKEVINRLALAVAYWYIKCISDDEVVCEADNINRYYGDSGYKYVYLICHGQINMILSRYSYKNEEMFDTYFNLGEIVSQKTYKNKFSKETGSLGDHSMTMSKVYSQFMGPSYNEFIKAAYKGIISDKSVYFFIFNKILNDNKNYKRWSTSSNILNDITLLASAIRDCDRQVAGRLGYGRWRYNRKKDVLVNLVGKSEDFNEEDKKLLNYADDVYQKVIDKILSAELNRGDSETEYSKVISDINRIYGLNNFVAILSALGKDTLERSYFSSSSKKGCLSHLLSVCIPDYTDSADKLREMVKGTDITDKRLIEAALYSPEWINIVGEYLGWEGFSVACYYFMAHMNESFDDKRKAVIARYTPITTEELNMGAFDVDWFHQAYETLGEKRFKMVYDAAKYISDGSKHARARKYADAALGKFKVKDIEITISDKRNKDLVMAYSLIPLKGEKDIIRRYLYLQKFLKESKKFGAQRSASEKKAVEISMSNLAMNAGYSDVMRLTLNMETKLIEDSREMFEFKEIDDISVRLNVDEKGKVTLICTKGEKELKSIPAKQKKNPYIVSLNEVKKKLTEQYRRTKVLFEQAMEDVTEFAVKEISALKNNPVVYPIIRDLVFMAGEKLGFLDDNKLIDYSGNITELNDDDKVIVAHAYNLYKDGHWTEYQRNLFDRKAVQPFKQVFRELYVKTEEEMEMNHSLRYSGNQIQPAKTLACLKSRRWVADIEDGLQKVYYKENIVARIYAMADWFSPADIEAPTLEWVEFSDRKTGKSLTIKDIPDIIFSEVMRDVDLAVSVAHAGGVDPETSHSTMEMRAALVSFTMPLFKVTNVTINGRHALIEGKYGNYTVHLGSGIIHKQGGIMINVLPVHSQHRGRLFLPFADDDPKTAEIISKILMFADDGKIKDPSILEQISK